MNFLHLKYFLLVAEELNITRAAERLFISQQSLSNHISNMEKELDVKLFTRSPKLSLTYAGDLLVETATQILDLHSQYLSKVGDINRHYLGVLRVGISHTCGLALLPEILPQFQAEFPMVEFSLFEGNSTHLEDELAHGRVDLIVCFQPIMMEGVEVVPLTEENLILVIPRSFTNQIFGDRAEEVRRQFREITEYLADFLREIFHSDGYVLHGGTPVKKRGEIVDAFQSEAYVPFIVLSVKAGGTGLNLTKANHVIHFDRWWNPAVENQATDRAFRIGQTKNVMVHKLACRGTIEEKIDALQEENAQLKGAIKKNEEAIEAHSVRIAELMKEHEHGILTTTTDKLLVDFVTSTSRRVSSDYLKQNYPTIYEEARKPSKNRKVKVTIQPL